jgi:branched-subunit amino acid ABC-type transport system permease component
MGVVIGQALVDGIAEGAIIALIAMAVTLLFRISHFANVAIGDTVTIGGYIGLLATSTLSLPLAIGVILSLLVTGIIGYVSFAYIFRPLGTHFVARFITSIGLALVLRALVQLIWGGSIHTYPFDAITSIRFAGIVLPINSLLVVVVCAIATGGFFWGLHHTRIGREIRATASDEELARTSGINVPRVVVIVWITASSLAGLAGVLLGTSTAVYPELGWNILLIAFAAAILGGLGNLVGAVAGGLIIGVAMQFAVIVAPAGFKQVIALLIMVLVLIVRPSGIIPTKVRL